jgi:hypothetical protein
MTKSRYADKDEWLTGWGYTLGTSEAEEAWVAKVQLDENVYQRTTPRSAGLILDMQPWDAYESPASGQTITSKAQRREDMKRTGSRQYEGRAQEDKEVKRQHAYQEQALDRQMTDTIGSRLAHFSPEQRAQLSRELGG